MAVHLLVAAAENDVIGRDGRLPWRLPADLKRFAALTRGHTVVMGRRTHESILARLGHPLVDRRSLVVSRSLPGGDGVEVVPSPEAAADAAGPGDWFVIGGATIYAALLPAVDVVELTRVHAAVDGDVRMPAGWLDGFTPAEERPGPPEGADLPFSFQRWERA